MKNIDKQTPVDHSIINLGSTMGSATGETEYMTVSGGWAGTDDATSTSISDQLGNPPLPEEGKPASVIEHDFNATFEKAEEEQLEALEEIAKKQILETHEKSNHVRHLH